MNLPHHDEEINIKAKNSQEYLSHLKFLIADLINFLKPKVLARNQVYANRIF